jgi:hypothetical protein
VSGGCSFYEAPDFRVVSISETDRSEEAVVLGFTLEARNRNDVALPLRRAEYRLTLDGRQVFEGGRVAAATAPRFGTQRIELPAVVPAELIPPERFDEAGEMAYRLEGSVEYQTPGRLAQYLFDINLRRPDAPLSLAGTLELPGNGLGEGGSPAE